MEKSKSICIIVLLVIVVVIVTFSTLTTIEHSSTTDENKIQQYWNYTLGQITSSLKDGIDIKKGRNDVYNVQIFMINFNRWYHAFFGTILHWRQKAIISAFSIHEFFRIHRKKENFRGRSKYKFSSFFRAKTVHKPHSPEYKSQLITGKVGPNDRISYACNSMIDEDKPNDGETSINQISEIPANPYCLIYSNRDSQRMRQVQNNLPFSKSYDPFPGMVLQVFPEGIDTSEFCGEVDTFAKTSKELEPIPEIQYTNNLLVDPYKRPCFTSNQISRQGKGTEPMMYELHRIIHGELGLIDVHNVDYAYRPVMSDPGANNRRWTRNGETMYESLGDQAFAGGSHGQVWYARRRCPDTTNLKKDSEERSTRHSLQSPTQKCDDKEELIIKRMKVHQRLYLLEAGKREVYFGEILSHWEESSSMFTEYVDHFFHKSSISADIELWIVFKHSGPSLRSYMYTPIATGDFLVYQHSPFWIQMRTGRGTINHSPSSSVVVIRPKNTPDFKDANNLNGDNRKQKEQQEHLTGKEGIVLLKRILKQLLSSAAKLHERGIVHRDIKPSNIMCKSDFDVNNERFWDNNMDIKCVLGDFSSAIDDFSSDNFYSNGPSPAEQSDDYAPPEVLFGPKWVPFYEAKPETYDSWSIGVIILELLLGTPNVFSVDQRTRALLYHKMEKEGASTEDIQRALYLAALSQFCIYTPMSSSGEMFWPLREGDPLFNASIVKTTCTIEDFHTALRARDPIGKGFDSSYDSLLQLIWGLLKWDPKERFTPSDALEHSYFTDVGTKDGIQNALESQILDPLLDINVGERVIREFVCPKCGRKFSDLKSCQAHAVGRRHAKFCTYDGSSLPPCLNAHSMLPAHQTSGYCDIQGRRRTIEDFHTVHLNDKHQFYGVFDGHNGNLASKYVSSSLYKRLAQRLEDIDNDIEDGSDWKAEVTSEIIESFQELHQGVLEAVQSYPSVVMSKSGTTVTALFVTEKAVIIANVGDSRAILSVAQSIPIQLTVDHVASNIEERKRIENLGGFVESRSGVPRVNGTLALSRSIGDAHLEKFLLQTPHLIAMTKEELENKCRLDNDNVIDGGVTCFIILASDGLWDVMSNEEAVDLVNLVLQKFEHEHRGSIEGETFQEAAEMLTKEAYVRGSTDNIACLVVCVNC